MVLLVLLLQTHRLNFLQRFDLRIIEIKKHLSRETMHEKKQFSNGRYIRNLFEELIMQQARRLSSIKTPTIEELKTLCTDDFKKNEIILKERV